MVWTTDRTYLGVDHIPDIFGVDHIPDIFGVDHIPDRFGADQIPDIFWVPPERKRITDRSPRLLVGGGLRPPPYPPSTVASGKSEATARVPLRAPGGTAT